MIQLYTCTVFSRVSAHPPFLMILWSVCICVLSYLIWAVPIQTVCRATIVICSHITTVPGGIQGLLPVPEGKTRIITTVLGVYTRPLFQRAKQGRLPLFQGALQGILLLFQRALQGLFPLFQGALQGLLPLFQGAYKAPLTRSQTSNVGNNSLVLSHGAS